MAPSSGIRIQALAKTYRSRKRAVQAVQDVNLTIEAGQVFGLLGPNGAGKTTTIRMVTGLLTPTDGSVTVDGLSVADQPEDVRRRIGLVPEDAGHLKNLTLAEEIRFYGAMFGLAPEIADRRAAPIAERLDIADRMNDRVRTFSRGMKRKAHLIRALVHDPSVLLLDEPTAGLDPSVTVEVWNLLRDLAAEGKTVVFCSHHLEEVERLCKRVAIIRRTVLAVGEPHTLSRDQARLEISIAADHETARRAAAALASHNGSPRVAGIGTPDVEGAALSMPLLPDADPESVVPAVVARLVGAGAPILRVAVRRSDLRSIYRAVVGAEPENGGSAPLTPGDMPPATDPTR